MKAFVIGDIHGCLKELKGLIKDIDRNETRILLVGDLIDRGKDSEKVVDFVRSNNIECVKGNHELMAEECISDLKEYIDNPTNAMRYKLYGSDWFYNGGHDVFNQYVNGSGLYKLIEDITWLSTLPLYIETGILDDDGLELLVSHTYMSHKELGMASRHETDFLWDRSQPYTKKNKSKYYNVYGHTPVDYLNQKKYRHAEVTPEPEWYDGCVAIDTGCAYNARGRGYLTGVYFPSLEVRQTKLQKD